MGREAVKWESYSQAERSSGPRIIDDVASVAMVVVVVEEEVFWLWWWWWWWRL